MIDQVLESFRKATESTMQIQQQMIRQWAQAWPQGAGFVPPASTKPAAPAWLEQAQSFQHGLASAITEMLERHRATLDAQYAAGIRTIEDAFKVSEARDPAELQRLTEALWKQSFECLKTVAEQQMTEFQAAMATWLEAVSKGVAAGKSS
ncbi:MAG: hypothetical protein U0794_12945 [Isosphaeraceae bacterium]